MDKKPPWAFTLGLQLRWLHVLALNLSFFFAAGSTFPSDKAALLEFKAGLQADQVISGGIVVFILLACNCIV